MNGILSRTKRLEGKMRASTKDKHRLQWLRDMFGYVKTDTAPPDGFFSKGTDTLRRIFFE